MLYNNKFSTILRSSKDIFYRFFIDKDKNLLLEEYSTSGLVKSSVFKENVLDYSIDMDENDNIHVLYLCSNGNLTYSVYPKTHNDKVLTQFQLTGNKIVFLFLKLLSSDIHIFYMINNVSNQYKWTIFHNMWHNSQWVSQKISDVTSIRYAYPLSVEFDDKNNLYLFFCKDGTSTFAIKKYCTEFNIWLDLEENLSLPGATNVSYFITKNNVEVLCFNQCINKTIQTFIKYCNLNKLNSVWSNSLLISNTNSIHPYVFTKDNLVYVIWEEGHNIMYRTSNNILGSWSEKKLLTAKNDSVINAVYKSNSSKDASFKSPYVYAAINIYPMPIINMQTFHNDLNKLNWEIPTKISYPNFRSSNYTPNVTENETSEKDKLIEKLIYEITEVKEQTSILEESNKKLSKKLSTLQDSTNLKVEKPKKNNWKHIFNIFK